MKILLFKKEKPPTDKYINNTDIIIFSWGNGVNFSFFYDLKHKGESMKNDNEFANSVEEDFPSQETKQSVVTNISSIGQTYDWSSAPDYVKSVPRVSMEGKTVVIKSADILKS